jgi:hypothetical protein
MNSEHQIRGPHLPDVPRKSSVKPMTADEYRTQIACDRDDAGRLAREFEVRSKRCQDAVIVLSAGSSIFGATAALADVSFLAFVPGICGALVVAINGWSASRSLAAKAIAYSAAERSLQRELVHYDARADVYRVDLDVTADCNDQKRHEAFLTRTQDVFDTLGDAVRKR